MARYPDKRSIYLGKVREDVNRVPNVWATDSWQSSLADNEMANHHPTSH